MGVAPMQLHSSCLQPDIKADRAFLTRGRNKRTWQSRRKWIVSNGSKKMWVKSDGVYPPRVILFLFPSCNQPTLPQRII